jgi:RNA polymerase sigma-70 factor, ECF subfamily
MSRAPAQSGRLEQLIVDYVGDVVAYCRWRCTSEEDAQDAVSEVFLVAWRRLDDVPDDEAARVWLLATARRVIANERRARGRRSRLMERVRVMDPPDAAEWPLEVGQGDVADALRQLDPADREILLLAEWEGLSSTEIGAVMGCLAVTARGRLHRARERFRTAYGQVESITLRPTSSAVVTAPPGNVSRANG